MQQHARQNCYKNHDELLSSAMEFHMQLFYWVIMHDGEFVFSIDPMGQYWTRWEDLGRPSMSFKWADLVDPVLNCWHELSFCPRLSAVDWLSCPLCRTAPFLSWGISPCVWRYILCLLETQKLRFHCFWTDGCWSCGAELWGGSQSSLTFNRQC